ncbi:unnamed protein product, partial [Ectocarpus sp. 12 AP-2014]
GLEGEGTPLSPFSASPCRERDGATSFACATPSSPPRVWVWELATLRVCACVCYRETQRSPPLSNQQERAYGVQSYKIPNRTTLQIFRVFLPQGVEVRRAWGGREQQTSKAVSRPFHLCP